MDTATWQITSPSGTAGKPIVQLDHMPITKIHISPAAMMRGMFCKICLQRTFIYSSKTPAYIFLNDLFCKIESHLDAIFSITYIAKKPITISISERENQIFIFG